MTLEHNSRNVDKRHPKRATITEVQAEETTTQRQRHHRRATYHPTSLDTRPILKKTMPPSVITESSRRSRNSRRISGNENDATATGRTLSRSIYRRDRPSQSGRSMSRSRFSSQHQFTDPASQIKESATPFDDNGYCVIHKDVLMAKPKGDEWKVLLMDCPKCLDMRDRILHEAKKTGSDLSGHSTDRTASSTTQDDSFDSPPQRRRARVRCNDNRYRTKEESREVTVGSRRRTQRVSYQDDQQEVRKSGNSFYSIDEEAGPRRNTLRPSYRDDQYESVRKSGNSFYSIDESRADDSRRKTLRPSYRDDHQEVKKSSSSLYSNDVPRKGVFRRRNPRVHVGDEMVVRSSGNSRSLHSSGRRSQRTEDEYGDEYENESHYEEEASYRSGRGRERQGRDSARSKSRARSRSRGACSRASRGSGRDRGPDKYVARPKPKTICVNGVPFDKNGCCFLHPHVKLASKKLLGGWKVHHTFCKACAVEAQYDDDDQSALTSRSGSTRHSYHSEYSEYSNDSRSTRHSRRSRSPTDRSRSRNDRSRSPGSVISGRSHRSARSWTSNQSRKRTQNDDSFLPLDADGYCVHHPDVQLAKLGKRGEWKVLMDFCPECAEASLMIGGAPGSKSPKTSKSQNSRKACDESTDKSQSEKMFVEKMPFIDNDGKPGHYTGYLDSDGRPDGRGKMKYVDGKKFDGIWEGGNQLEGKVSYKKNKGEKKKKSRS